MTEVENIGPLFLLSRLGLFYTGQRWTVDLQKALFCTSNEAGKLAAALSGSKILCVIHADYKGYFNGRAWEFYAKSAKLYAPQEAEKIITKLKRAR